jgi:hypothetical protein
MFEGRLSVLGLRFIAIGAGLDACAFFGYILLTYYYGHSRSVGYSYFESMVVTNLVWGAAGLGCLAILIGGAMWAFRTTGWSLLGTGAAIGILGWLVSRIKPDHLYNSYEALLALSWVTIGVFGPWFVILAAIRFVSEAVLKRRVE